MLACFEDATESTWGLPSVGPKRRSRVTSALTSTCSASLNPYHHAPNSSVNSTSHSSKGIYLQKPFRSRLLSNSGDATPHQLTPVLSWYFVQLCRQNKIGARGSAVPELLTRHSEVSTVRAGSNIYNSRDKSDPTVFSSKQSSRWIPPAA